MKEGTAFLSFRPEKRSVRNGSCPYVGQLNLLPSGTGFRLGVRRWREEKNRAAGKGFFGRAKPVVELAAFLFPFVMSSEPISVLFLKRPQKPGKQTQQR